MQVTSAPVSEPARSTGPGSELALARGLCAVIGHIHRECAADLIEAAGSLELTLPQMKLMHRLQREADRELSLGEAAEQAHLSLPTASRLIDDLVRRELVHRSEDPEDRRVKRVRLTAAGDTVLRRLDAARLRGVRAFVATLQPDERTKLSDAVTALLARTDIDALPNEGTSA
jgi:DNA-binding MarR family transcriptional regulator